MRRRFWRKVALFAWSRAYPGCSPPLRHFRASTPTTTMATGSNVTVTWTQS